MNILTHIDLSRLLYQRLKDKIELDQGAFIYGNAMKEDIVYAISTALWVCDSVSYYFANSSEPVLHDEKEAYPILSYAGGK